MATHFDIDTKSDNLAKIAEVVEGRRGRLAMEEFVRKRLANLQPDAHLKWLLSRRWQAIFTTNYDSCIERAYEINDKPLQRAITIAATHELVSYDPRLDVPVYHLHGALFGQRGGIVITESDYTTYRDRRRMLFDLLKSKFATAPILYIGYGNQDQNWRQVWAELTEEFLPSTPPVSYRVSPATDPLDLEILKSKGVETIDATLAEFSALASAVIAESESEADRLKSVKAQVPSQLLPVFEKNMAAVARLLSSWIYVNQAPFAEKPNVYAFLRGDRANWALIGSKQHFSRDIEQDICDEVLDLLTGAPTAPFSLLALGAAGYGITTILMSVAVTLIQEGAANVFMHRPGTPLNEGDIVFAASLSKQPTVLVVDDVADNIRVIQGAITTLRGNKTACVFILGERLNEWRQRRASFSCKEFSVDSLSQQEINRLLDCLGNHNALNKLAPLTRELQVAVIQEKHGKELLVAMREATEGKGFDAILEDEFRSIESPFARSVYLAVACVSQHGAYLRDGVLAKVLEVNIVKLYESTKDILDGVVIYDCIDEAAGIYGARARHRTVAEIVWERAGAFAERDRLLQLVLANLNLNFSADVNAFERFIRSDRLIDGIRTFEGRVQFFETACRKDPASPYVRQHYARMLSRADKPELALDQIEQGFKLRENAPPRVLFHTKGLILTKLAIETESEGFARRRLVQAEDAFRKALSLNPRDEYVYQGLASLYLAWAKRATTEAEVADYVGKSEAVISEGLKKVKDRDGLWIITAEIQMWLGNEPSHIKALETATASSPGSVIARYLLGRTYRHSGQPEKAILVLEPIVKSHPDEYRAFIEYGLSLVDLGKPYESAIAILNISTTYGLGDARFVATFGGLLFLSGDHAGAEKVFRESVRREFPYSEATTIHFRPKRNGAAIQLLGKIVVIKPSFALIETEGYPMFICPRAKQGSAKLAVGGKVKFSVEFSAKGPVAVWPQTLS
jgi:tetratricopeptide (TPR) repeat protein